MMSLKLCCFTIVFVALTNAGLTPEQIEAFQTVMDNCKAKTGATDDDIAVIMKKEVPDSTNALCFTACVTKAMNIMKDDNSLDQSKIEEMLAPLKEKDENSYNTILKIVNTCTPKTQEESDECQASKKLMQCFKDEAESSELKMDLMSLIS